VSEEPITHREIKEKLIEIGKLQGFILEQLKFIDLERIKELYESKRAFLDLEKELGL